MAKAEDNLGVLKQLAATMLDFDPRFEIMSGTKAQTASVIPTDTSAVPGQFVAE